MVELYETAAGMMEGDRNAQGQLYFGGRVEEWIRRERSSAKKGQKE